MKVYIKIVEAMNLIVEITDLNRRQNKWTSKK
jgi:hypothetical protein